MRPIFEAWMAPFHDFGMTTLAPASVGSTDHVAFDDAGLPGFQFLQARVGGTGGHTNLDFYDTLPVDDLKKNAVVVAAFVYHGRDARGRRLSSRRSAACATRPSTARRPRGQRLVMLGAHFDTVAGTRAPAVLVVLYASDNSAG